MDVVQVTSERLLLQTIVDLVHDPTAGAIATFSGTTRNHFHGKAVLKLEYEAFVPMAEKELSKLCTEARERWALHKIAIFHRIGEVPIGETSVIIAVSSVHRRDALEAVEFLIDTLKLRVPIWKKEFYADGSQWKANNSC